MNGLQEKGNVPTMPSKLANLWGEYYAATEHLSQVRAEAKRSELRVAELTKEWQALLAVADKEMEEAALSGERIPPVNTTPRSQY